MAARGPYGRHSAQFKLQHCHDIRSGALGRSSGRCKDCADERAMSPGLI